MILKNFKDTIGIFPNAVPLDICNDIITTFEEYKSRDEGFVYPGNTLGGFNPDVKITHDLNLMGFEGHSHLHNLSYELAWRSTELIDKFLLSFPQDPTNGWNHYQMWSGGTHYPIWNVQKYDKGVGHYHGWHTEENYSRNTCNRLMVACYYLNDVEEGGEIVFPLSDIKFKPKAGTFACFPPGWPWVHYAETPISNDKYLVTTWLQANWMKSIEFKDEDKTSIEGFQRNNPGGFVSAPLTTGEEADEQNSPFKDDELYKHKTNKSIRGSKGNLSNYEGPALNRMMES